MSTTDTRSVGPTRPEPLAPSVVLDALLTWDHRDGAPVRALIRVRGLETQPGALQVTVVASQLRDNPPGLDVLADVAGLANAVCNRLIGPAVDRSAIAWYAHHGSFSSYDPTGPDTLTRVHPRWDGATFHAPDLDDEQLLDTEHADALTQALALSAVDEVLAAQHWSVPGPRPAHG